MDRRLSTHSDSSQEPMDISSSINRTASSTTTDANNDSSTLNSLLLLNKSRHQRSNAADSSDNVDSDSEDHHRGSRQQQSLFLQQQSVNRHSARSENLHQLMDNMLRRKFHSLNNNNNYGSSGKRSPPVTTLLQQHLSAGSETNNNNNNHHEAAVEPGTEYVCPICNTVSATKHDFTEHIRSHNNSKTAGQGESGEFVCKICSKVLSSASSLDRHVLVHTGERPFNCKYCQLTFTTNGNMHRHMRTHKQSERESYESDGSTDSGGSSTGGSSGTMSNNNNNSYGNNNYDGEGKRKACDENVHYKRKIRTINNNHLLDGSVTEGVQKFCCPVCIRNDFSSMVSLEHHMDREHPQVPAKCRHCDVVFKSYKALNAHRCGNNNYQNITPGFKDLTFVDFSSEKFPLIAKSVCEQSIRTPVTSQKFECTKCYRAFPCSKTLEMHTKDCGVATGGDYCPPSLEKRRWKTSEASTEASEDDLKRDDFFANLDLQNKSMSTTTNMSSSNVSEAPTTPSSLDKSFSSPVVNIKQEPNYYHHSGANYPPQQDTKDLADIQSIINVTSSGGFFRQQLDKDPYPKEEEEAQDAFTSEFRKMKLRGEFPCRLCTAVFPNLRALKGHNRIHVSAAGPGPYRCNMCPYIINDKATLIRHMRTHNGDRPYECALCNYAFTTKANCERHLRNRHGRTTRDEVKRAIIYHPSEDSSCEDPLKKMQMFNTPPGGDFDRELDDHTSPSDRSTPVSHLKEMLMPIPMSLVTKIDCTPVPPTTPAKIQVKSLEKLNQLTPPQEQDYDKDTPETPVPKPMDLSMDALDLSKKPEPLITRREHDADSDHPRSDAEDDDEVRDDDAEDEDDDDLQQQHHQQAAKIPKLDLSLLEKNQLLMQQKFFTDALAKMDPAHYFQLSQLYSRFQLPAFPLHPLFLQNPLLCAPGALGDLKNFFPKEFPMLPQMSGGSLIGNPFHSPSESPKNAAEQQQQSVPVPPAASPLPAAKHYHAQPSPQSLPKSPMPPQQQQQPQPHHHHHHQQQQPPSAASMPSIPLGNGPVKMVIKNGVLMPKQKQRRYRTERPFACEHCSARFTLRSNMERHIKQQHPQFWSQRQRGGHHMMRGGRGHSAAGSASNTATSGGGLHPHHHPMAAAFGGISEQVKYAILAQQSSKGVGGGQAGGPPRSDGMSSMLQNIIAQGQGHPFGLHAQLPAVSQQQQPSRVDSRASANHHHHHQSNNNGHGADDEEEEDERELVIDEEFQPEDLTKGNEEDDQEDDEEDEDDDVVVEQVEPKRESPVFKHQILKQKLEETKEQRQQAAKAVADGILEQAMRQRKELEKEKEKEMAAAAVKSAAAESGKDSGEADLVPVSKLVDNATNVAFENYFSRPDVPLSQDQSDEEGLVASGSASESNNSGTDDPNPSSIHQQQLNKKKSAYSLAPNRVSCPYCQRMFPWSSSLRRHILTHTGQKPFKCSQCTLLFTTKSNCDRHLLRKHGDVETAMSIPVPIDDLLDPKPEPVPVAVAEAIHAKSKASPPSSRPASPKPVQPSAAAGQKPEQDEDDDDEDEEESEEEEEELPIVKPPSAIQEDEPEPIPSPEPSDDAAKIKEEPPMTADENSSSIPPINSDLPFKCHLCEGSFADRVSCLDHIKQAHVQEFALLMNKVTLEAESEAPSGSPDDDESGNNGEGGAGGRGKFPDYANRKVICAFCLRRFWSTEDLRRHMRTHSGERPFQCDVCRRRFTLKHSMLRHQRKHKCATQRSGTNGLLLSAKLRGEPGSDMSDDEPEPQAPAVAVTRSKTATTLQNSAADLIGNLLGISDQGILNRMLLGTASDAAKLLGVEK